MIDALRYEWVRLRTLRSTWWLTGLTLLIAGLLGLPALGVKGALSVSDYGDLVTGGGGLAVFLESILLSLIGIFAIGHEYRYGTIRPTLSALPRRSTVFAAKLVVVAAYALGVTVICTVVRYLVGLAILGHRLLTLGAFPGPIGRVWFGTIIYTLLFTLAGVGLAGLFRSIPAAIVVIIVLPLIVENVIRGLLTIHAFHSIRGIAKGLPFTAGAQIVSQYGGNGGNGNNSTSQLLPSPFDGLLIFVVFLVLLVGLSWFLFEKRDA